MKKFFAALFCVLLVACDDGDFDLPAFDFGETVYNCVEINNEQVLFRIATAEALILTIGVENFKEEVTTEPIEIPISEDNVIYRTFNGEVTPEYFCEPIPPVEPSVSANWVGIAGSENYILIETTEELDDDTNALIGYRHSISFQNLKLESGNNFIVYEEEYFGDYIIYL